MNDFVAVAFDVAGNVKAFTTGTESTCKAAAQAYKRKENGFRVYPVVKVMTAEKWEAINKEELQVIFRKDKSGNITAFFPGMRCNYGMIACYQHIGQHSEASIGYYMDTVQAQEKEYMPLLEELTGIYNDCRITIKKRLPNGGNVEAWH